MKALDLDVLAMIVAVADTGNISRAAEVVHRSQSAVSMQIKTLEAALGKPLFVRRPRSVTPTHSEPVKSQFFLPMAIGRMAFSTGLLCVPC